MPSMEGALWKWTNYMSGWQLRWFVLDVGVLSYYKSQDDIGLGSRGSVKMGCCEVSTPSHDSLRIDLKIPPDQYIYIKAVTPAERQQWVVALGSSKACLTQGTSQGKPKRQNNIPHQAKVTLTEKMLEVHTCKDILVDQINSIKKLCKTKEDKHEFQEAATILSATCDTFLNDLTDCVRMAEQQLSSTSPVSPLSSPRKSQLKTLSLPKNHTTRESHSNSLSSHSSPSPTSSTFSNTSQKSMSPVQENQLQKLCVADSNSDPHTPPSEQAMTKDSKTLNHTLSETTQQESVKRKRLAPTLFSSCPNRFSHVHVMEDGGIPTKVFLLACNSILPIFDVLGPTAFAPVKLDISGNIKKLKARYENDIETCSTLQSMINSEIQSDSCTAKNSATDALLWLKRALQFTNAFLEEINKGERELVVVASTAYSKTLRKYHGWMVRGVFAMAVKAVPYWKDFVKALGTTDSGVAPESDVLIDIREFTNTLGALIDRINAFYFVHKLDVDNTV